MSESTKTIARMAQHERTPATPTQHLRSIYMSNEDEKSCTIEGGVVVLLPCVNIERCDDYARRLALSILSTRTMLR
ncbi:hypothetical protein OH76DRAFT_1403051 [Lentinus brumalis]|uniref:Uncharacterized protein n=1 Tax=Lentinus brumalis TaxID=2498619 RepID=A0A371DC85_9APHY|nr:hypothetical protein OH76DRAFT_1403051 [Polyporus brumalis]